ncbi:MAG TPA: prepilin-type N-terminal cleavage/methylation domain-containing protein [Symbiobacteriaceae bacterium]|nr:prepilin-type N-terminal cleavage/methylation domain-containing protein [Symbiobacteriaceae bacterium]
MLWRRLLRERRGVTLVELIVGIAIAGLILITVTSTEIFAWRYRKADEQAFAGQAEATTLLDRFAQDVRQSTGISLPSEGASTVTITVAGAPVTYQLDVNTKEIRRQGRVLMRDATGLAFYREDGGRTLRAVVTATHGYRLESRATTRLGP